MKLTFKERFQAMVRTATPLVMIQSFDPRASIRHILEALTEAKDRTDVKKAKSLLDSTGISQWDCCRGLHGVNDMGIQQIEQALSQMEVDPANLLVAQNLYKFLASAPDTLLVDHFVFMMNAHKFWAQPEEVQGLWNLRDILKNKGSMLILLSAPGSTLPEEIAQDVFPLEEPLPTAEQVEQIITKSYEAAKKLGFGIAVSLPGDVMKKSVAALNGLPVFPTEQAAQMCLNSQTGAMNTEELWAQKRQTIAQRAGLSMYDGSASLADVADLDNVVQFLRRLEAGPESPNIVLRMDEMEKAFAGSGTDLSGDQTKLTGSILTWFQDKRINGIIFLGVPGCGKSELLFAWAKGAGKPIVNVDLPGMQGSLLGQSMANLKAAEKTIDAMGGGRVLAIATVNDVGTLPAPLLRRFNLGTFFFDIPKTDEARMKILAIHRKKYKISAKDAAPDMHLWTGSDIENCCKRAYMLGESLQDASKNVVKVMVARREEMDNLRKSASNRYISASESGIYTYYDPYEKSVASTEGGRRLKG